MVHKIQNRKKYPSDLTDEQWTILGPMIPPRMVENLGCLYLIEVAQVWCILDE
jgi:hypothetical protein